MAAPTGVSSMVMVGFRFPLYCLRYPRAVPDGTRSYA
jgi:hypothetical protein